MDERVNRIAALANVLSYDEEAARKYVDGSPHVKHAALRELYGKLVVQVFDQAKKNGHSPKVLDLGAGEGSVTLPFLELGAQVVAVDISPAQLRVLKDRCDRFEDRLEIRCEDINETLKDKGERFDIVVANSFLHHIPDYLGMIKEITKIVSPHGQIFTFQDPLHFDSVGRLTMAFTSFAYFSWRIFKGDVIAGMQRRIRRARGVYLEDSQHDNAEYHAVRKGVDQEAIYALLKTQGFDCQIVKYFSTQSRFFQFVGTELGVKNTFAVTAQKR